MARRRNPYDAVFVVRRHGDRAAVCNIRWRETATELDIGARVGIEAGDGTIRLFRDDGAATFSVIYANEGWMGVELRMPPGTVASPYRPMDIVSARADGLILAPAETPPAGTALASLLACSPCIRIENRRTARRRGNHGWHDHPVKPAAVIDPSWPRYEDSPRAAAANLTGRLVTPATVVPRCGCLDVSGKRERWE